MGTPDENLEMKKGISATEVSEPNEIRFADELNKAFFETWQTSGRSRRTKTFGRIRRLTAYFLVLIMIVTTVFPALMRDSTWAEPDNQIPAGDEMVTTSETEAVPETILSFERMNPVYTETVDYGTPEEDLELSGTLRAVVEMEVPKALKAAETKGVSGTDVSGSDSLFVQTAPAAVEEGYYDYYWYGYVAPRNEQELRLTGELVIYTIYYADETEGYRVHGTYAGLEEGFYACDKEGNITGIVKEVAVTWSRTVYEPEEADTYTFTAEPEEGYEYEGEDPTAEITVEEKEEETAAEESDGETMAGESDDETTESESVEDAESHSHDELEEECTCGTTTDKHDETCIFYTPECTCDQEESGHIKGCPLWNPDCTCPEESEGHTSESCPYYMPPADCDCGIDADCKPYQHLEGCPYFSATLECTCPGEKHDYANKDCLKYMQISTYSINGGGANDTASDTIMRNDSPTSGSASYTSAYTAGLTIPGSWVDYVNTIWRNKGYNEFAWTKAENTNAHMYSGTRWAWSGNTASQTTGTVTTNQYRIPAKSGTVWTVYSGEQLRYALINLASGDTVRLGANINLNGSAYSWASVNISTPSSKGLIFDGNGKTIYNLGSRDSSPVSSSIVDASNCSLFKRYTTLTISNVTFETAKLVSSLSSGYGGGYAALIGVSNGGYARTATDIEVNNCLIYAAGHAGIIHLSSSVAAGTSNWNRVFATGNYIYGGDHISGMTTRGGNVMTANNCASYDNLICSYGGHLSGFTPCSIQTTNLTDCFAANEIYGSALVSGFQGIPGGVFTNCYSSGKVEGYSQLAGFMFAEGTYGKQTINNCYSTTLVGLRSRAQGMTSSDQYQGGFVHFNSTNTDSVVMNDCYAAGEVGNYDVDLSAPKTVGGFVSSTTAGPNITKSYSNCYYDKQTTAMREWTAGDTKTLSNVTGVLTSTTTKGGIGLASGSYGTSGFTGFSDNSKWVYTAEHYPQLEVFANATAAAWGGADHTDAVRAWSLASTATVFLDTWETGYDWDTFGVRTAGEVSYDRPLSSTGLSDHVGYEYTYDTVREIVTDFTVTNVAANATTWTQMIPGGAPAELKDSLGNTTSITNNIAISASTGTVNNPGLDWYQVSETVNGQTGFRPLRLIAYMTVEAGASQSVPAGFYYDHRKDVELTMMDSITDNLVVGLDDARNWSTATTQGYPNTVAYYGGVTDPTGFSASNDAWVYTSIWRAKKDSNGDFVDSAGNPTTDDTKLVPEYSVKVTGVGTGNNLTMDEQKWNGGHPLYPDTSASHKYIITYFWMLSDGRYRFDQKVITITPGEYDVAVDVYNTTDDSANGTALYPAAAPDDGANPDYTYPTLTGDHTETLDNIYTTNVTAAWEKKYSNTTVDKMTVTLTAGDKTTVMGTATITGDIRDGTQITIPISCYYVDLVWDSSQNAYREVTLLETADITYTVGIDAEGGYYLRFNKLANVPATEVAWAYAHGDSTGIPSTAEAYINDLSHNIQIDLYVTEACELEITKELAGAVAEEDEQFVFQIDYCGNAASGPGAVERTMYAVAAIQAGNITWSGEFVNMPAGWYTVVELESNWRFDLLSSQLALDNSSAIVDASNAKVTMRIEGDRGTYLYKNERLDIPWANGKDSITNDMPSLGGASGSTKALPFQTDSGSTNSVEAVPVLENKRYKAKAMKQINQTV